MNSEQMMWHTVTVIFRREPIKYLADSSWLFLVLCYSMKKAEREVEEDSEGSSELRGGEGSWDNWVSSLRKCYFFWNNVQNSWEQRRPFILNWNCRYVLTQGVWWNFCRGKGWTIVKLWKRERYLSNFVFLGKYKENFCRNGRNDSNGGERKDREEWTLVVLE